MFALGCLLAAKIPHTGWLLALIVAGAPAGPFDRHGDVRRKVSLFAMPLYGRELARALAVEPCFAGLAVPLAAILGLATGGRPFEAAMGVTIVAATLAASLVGLSASLRTGPNAALYIALAVAAEAAIVAPLILRPAHPLLFTVPVAIAIAFFALRAFGETLARYDPLPAL